MPNYDFDARIAALGNRMNAGPYQGSPLGVSSGPSSQFTENFVPSETQTDPSFFERVFDVASRPMYAVENLIKDTIDPNAGTQNPLESLWAGLSGIDKTTGRDVLQKAEDVSGVGMTDWSKGLAGFGLDLLLDPTNLIPVSWAAKGLKAASGASKALSGEAKLAEKIKAGEGLQEYSKKEAKWKGATFQEKPKEKPGAPVEEQVPTPEPVVEAKAAVNNEERRASVADTVTQETAANPVSSLPALEDLSTATPSNLGAKTKPLKIFNLDPATLDFVKGEFEKNLHPSTGYTREEAAKEAATAAARSQGDIDQVYRSAFHTDPVLGPDIIKQVAESQPIKTPKIDTVPIPEAVNISDIGKVVNPKASEARLGNDYEQARRTQELTNRHWRAENPVNLGETEKFTDKISRVYDSVSADLRQAKEESFQAGAYPVVPLGENAFNIHVSDVFDSLGKQGERFHLSNYDKVPTSSLLQGAAKVVEGRLGGLTGDELVKSVADQVMKANKTRKPTTATRAERVAKALVSVGDDLERRMVANEARIGKRDLVQGEAMGTKVADEVKKTVNDPLASTKDKIGKVADVNGKISRESKIVGVSPGGQVVAAKRAHENLSDTLVSTDVAGARAAEGAAKDAAKGTKEANKKVKKRQQEQMNKDEKALLEDPNVKHVDISEQIHENLQTGVHRLYSAILGGTVHGFRTGGMAAQYRRLRNAAEMLQSDYNSGLRSLSKKYTNDQLNVAFTILSSGLKPADDMAPIVNELKPYFDHLMDKGGEGNVANIATRSGISIDTWNEMMKKKGLPEFQFPTQIKGNKNPTMADVWHLSKDWKITGPKNDKLLDFMSRFQSVATEVVARQTVMNDLTRRFGSDTFKPGYVKVARMPFDRAPLSHFIDNDVFIPREIAFELSNFNRMIDAKTSFAGQKGLFAGFANNVLDPYTRLLKPTQTIFRPGHHIRNNTGDFSMNILAGMNNPVKHYRIAGKAMMAGGKIRKDSFEGAQALHKQLKLDDNLGKDVMTVKLKDGQEVTLNPAQFYQVGMRNGVPVSYKSAEDILQSEGKGAVTKMTDKLMESRPAEFAGKVSEDSGNLHRYAQLSHILSDPKFTSQFDNIDDAVAEAAQEIFKYHPDVGGLANFESKYGRRAILYYTWMRQAIPTILGASLARPGRITAVPKAYYNAQVAMGMDPESIQEPFSNESLIPSFLRENVSGNFGTHTFNLGTPAETLNDVLSHGEEGNPIKTIGSYVGESLNPLFTLPVEMAQGQEISGKHVTDQSNNLDQAIPFFNQIASLNPWGASPSGTIGNIIGGAEGPTLDPQRQQVVGENDNQFLLHMLNFATGLGVQDTERPTYKRYSIKEQRN